MELERKRQMQPKKAANQSRCPQDTRRKSEKPDTAAAGQCSDGGERNRDLAQTDRKREDMVLIHIAL